MTLDTSITTPDISSTGHIFGRFGQGSMTLYDYASPFYWGIATAVKKPAMLVSIFPGTDSDSGLTIADQKIIIKAKAKNWASLDSVSYPS